jgi:hypothetical protein
MKLWEIDAELERIISTAVDEETGEISEEAAKALGVEVKHITGTKEMLCNIKDPRLMEIELFMKLPFDAMA